jgi:signal recognition particle receptor subunit beta
MFVHRAQLVVRLAYAGAPLSGKTETVKSLLSSLHGKSSGVTVYSPLEARGRTVYFDWGQYQGGSSFAGPIQCQITSVPGQTNLHRRRRVLVEDADVVVLVFDSHPDQLEANRRSLAELRPWLERGDLPPIGVLYQANKRDLPGALSFDALREELRLQREVEIYPSTATSGEGVRSCFVAAVRACIQRAEALRKMNRLGHDQPPVTTGEQLLHQLRTAEVEGEGDAQPAAEESEASLAAAAADAADRGPRTGPSDTAPHPPITDPEPVPEAATPVDPPVPSQLSIAKNAPVADAPLPVRTMRPAVMPFADWLATQRQPEESASPNAPISEFPPAATGAGATSDATATSASVAAQTPQPASAAAAEPNPSRRPAVMPMADWLGKTRTGDGRSAPRSLPPPLRTDPPAPSVSQSAPAVRSTEPSVPLPAPQPASVARRPQGPPAPWIAGEAGTLQEVWPPPVWDEIVRGTLGNQEEPAHRSGEAWQGRVGTMWHARAARVLSASETARTEFRRMVAWLMQLGDMVSTSRCIVLAGNSEGWCVWQVVRHEVTLDLLIRRVLEEKVLSKNVVHVLAQVATDYVAAAQDFALRGAGLPVRLKTLAHAGKSTVYSAFLPMAPMPTPERDALANLAHELRAIVPPAFVGAAIVTEALRELERLREERPQMKSTFEVLQHVLIGE